MGPPMSLDRADCRDVRPGITDPAARLAGLLYVGTIAGGLYAELGVRAGEMADLVMLAFGMRTAGKSTAVP